MSTSVHLSHSDRRILDQSRRQLLQLMQTIGSILNTIHSSPTLPPLESLNIQASILITNIQNIVSHITNKEHRKVFDQVVAYPSTNFPGRDLNKEDVLTELLRKKVEVGIDPWVSEGKRKGEEYLGAGVGEEGEEGGGDITKVWDEIYEWFGERVAKFAEEEAGAQYTAEEQAMGIENVNTGNKRDYEDEEGSDDEGEKKKEEGAVPGVGEKSAADLLRFWSTGQAEAFKQDNSHMMRKR